MDVILGASLIAGIVLCLLCTPVLTSSCLKNALNWVRLKCMCLYIQRKKSGRRLPNHAKDLFPKKPNIYELGVLSDKSERRLEQRQEISHEKDQDGAMFWGTDWNQNEIVVRLIRRVENIAEVWLLLKANDQYYQLPTHPESRVVFVDNPNGRIFSAGGLRLQCLCPMRRWRISYNGLMKQAGKDSQDAIHVKFSFIWTALTCVDDSQYDFENIGLASALESSKLADMFTLDLQRFKAAFNSYEQWGQFCGTLNLGEAEEKKLWMWGPRNRNMENEQQNERRVRLNVSMQNGVKIGFEARNIPGFLTYYFNGNCYYQNNMEYPVTSCQTNFLQLATNCRFGSEFSVSFICAKSKDVQTLLLRFMTKSTYLTGIRQRTDLYFLEVNFGKEEGRALLQYTYCTPHDEANPLVQPVLLLQDKVYREKAPMTVLLNDVACQSSDIVGGKGLSLGLLTALSLKCNLFTVPSGCVITTSAYAYHLEKNPDISKAITSLEKILGSNIREDVENACKRIQWAFESTQVNGFLKDSLLQTFCKVFGKDFENKSLAVRSSACGEDSEELSAAGQMSTILGVKGLSSILRAILKCWASHFRYEAVQYERQNGQPITSPMAVVIQEMVQSESAGVMFTVHPVNNDPSYLCITANYGLGESVVSASAEPDTVTLKRKNENDLEIHSVEIGSKGKQVIVKDDGVEEVTVVSTDASRCCLLEEMALHLGRIGVMVEKCFCSARDIEWAIKDGKIFLLQARPITTIDAESDFLLTHDLDSSQMTNSEYWTKANTGEVFPNATSPLCISVLLTLLDANIQCRLSGMEGASAFQPVIYSPKFVTSSSRHIFINVIDILFKRNHYSRTVVQKAFEVAIFGRVLDSKEFYDRGVERYGYTSKMKLLFGMVLMCVIYILGFADRRLNKVSSLLQRLTIDAGQNAAEAYKHITEKLIFFREPDVCHGICTTSSCMINVLVLLILGKDKQEWDCELFTDFATLLSSCDQVESADVPSAIKELADSIRKGNREKFISLPPKDAVTWLQEEKGEIGRKYNSFLEKHGHRCVREFDFAIKPWRMDPTTLVESIQSIVRSNNTFTNTKKVMTVKESIEFLKTPLGNLSKKFLSWMLPLCRSCVGLREQSKSKYIKTIDVFRSAYCKLAEKLVQEGRLPSSELVYFLTHEEIGDLIQTRSPALVRRAVKRQRLHKELDDIDFPEIVFGVPKPVKEETTNDVQSTGVTLKGTPVSYGVIKARARVILRLEEAKTIQAGEILITKATDIGWSPYFPVLAGVITELGGLISHGAVVAREYGIPCIVDVKRATAVFKTGDFLLLDATKGLLTRIDEQQTNGLST